MLLLGSILVAAPLNRIRALDVTLGDLCLAMSIRLSGIIMLIISLNNLIN